MQVFVADEQSGGCSGCHKWWGHPPGRLTGRVSRCSSRLGSWRKMMVPPHDLELGWLPFTRDGEEDRE
uniref:Uncharacterized protein n=1 Tax=Oryza glumipatula TaxID=40148 RepID=A0A0E0BQU6_9ORYZ